MPCTKLISNITYIVLGVLKVENTVNRKITPRAKDASTYVVNMLFQFVHSGLAGSIKSLSPEYDILKVCSVRVYHCDDVK
jgi:hypothetical protein